MTKVSIDALRLKSNPKNLERLIYESQKDDISTIRNRSVLNAINVSGVHSELWDIDYIAGHEPNLNIHMKSGNIQAMPKNVLAPRNNFWLTAPSGYGKTLLFKCLAVSMIKDESVKLVNLTAFFKNWRETKYAEEKSSFNVDAGLTEMKTCKVLFIDNITPMGKPYQVEILEEILSERERGIDFRTYFGSSHKISYVTAGLTSNKLVRLINQISKEEIVLGDVQKPDNSNNWNIPLIT